MKFKVEELYIDWVNNFLTVEGFASWYHISVEKANRIIDLGRKLNHRRPSKGCALCRIGKEINHVY